MVGNIASAIPRKRMARLASTALAIALAFSGLISSTSASASSTAPTRLLTIHTQRPASYPYPPEELASQWNGGGLYLPNNSEVQTSSRLSTLIMQSDGNLVLYDENWVARWQSGTVGRGDHAVFQTDGNLVVYNSSGGAVWQSQTYPNPGAVLALQNDGNLVIYPRALWATYTVASSQLAQWVGQVAAVATFYPGGQIESPTTNETLIMQSDGNLVLSDVFGHALWQSGTAGRGYDAVFQSDGNFVVYNSSGGWVWQSHTYPHPGAVLALQDDGNLVIYDRAIWETNTAH